MSRRRSSSSRRDSTGSRRNSLLSISLFDFPPTPGGQREITSSYGDCDPFAPLSLSEPLPFSQQLEHGNSMSSQQRSQTIDRLLGDRSESSGVSIPTVVSASSYSSRSIMPLSNASMLASSTNPMDQYQRHNPITPNHTMVSKPTLGSVTSSSTLAMAAPVKSLGEDQVPYDEDNDELNQHRFKPFHEEKWSLRYKELLEFHKENGHAAVPHTYPANPQLARWVKRQRRQFKLRRDNRQSTMTTERLDLLNSVGFIWDSHDVNWREKLDGLSQFRREHGHCNVPSNYRDKKLATWVKCQRRQYKLYWDGKPSAMNPERILELEKVGFEWEIRSTMPRSATKQKQQQQETQPTQQPQVEQQVTTHRESHHQHQEQEFNLLYQTISDL